MNMSSHCGKKATQKINSLSREAPITKFEQSRLILNAIITFHFSYCSVAWMFYKELLKEMFVFQKIWRALFSCNTCFEIRPFALSPTKYGTV